MTSPALLIPGTSQKATIPATIVSKDKIRIVFIIFKFKMFKIQRFKIQWFGRGLGQNDFCI